MPCVPGIHRVDLGTTCSCVEHRLAFSCSISFYTCYNPSRSPIYPGFLHAVLPAEGPSPRSLVSALCSLQGHRRSYNCHETSKAGQSMTNGPSEWPSNAVAVRASRAATFGTAVVAAAAVMLNVRVKTTPKQERPGCLKILPTGTVVCVRRACVRRACCATQTLPA